MEQEVNLKILTPADLDSVASLAQQLNPQLTLEFIEDCLSQMFEFGNYNCFGLLNANKLVGISSAWTTIRLYSGKQLEIDNVVVDASLQSKGFGKKFLALIEDWAKTNGYKTVELNTYVQNAKSHKFYFNSGYTVLGFHFWKHI